jgi:peptidoglycan/LPS O-acetylase OafA/YrhL
VTLFSMLIPGYPHGVDATVAIFYLSDYGRSLFGIPKYIGHTWSLSVEEHFYLLWPLILRKFSPSAAALLVAYIGLTGWRVMRGNWSTFYPAFDSHCTGLVLGCMIAGVPRSRIPAWPALLGLLALGLTLQTATKFSQVVGISLAELGSAIAILGKLPAWLSTRFLIYIGKLSYGIYLWHVPIVMWCRVSNLGWVETTLLMVPGSMVLAAISYHTIEAWLHRNRHYCR